MTWENYSVVRKDGSVLRGRGRPLQRDEGKGRLLWLLELRARGMDPDGYFYPPGHAMHSAQLWAKRHAMNVWSPA